MATQRSNIEFDCGFVSENVYFGMEGIIYVNVVCGFVAKKPLLVFEEVGLSKTQNFEFSFSLLSRIFQN